MRCLPWCLVLVACGGEVLQPERQICRSSLECPAGQSCRDERCVSDRSGPGYRRPGAGCEDGDDDREGFQLVGTQRLLKRQVCPARPDRYWTTAHEPLRAQIYLVRLGESTPELVLANREVEEPKARCGAGDVHCSQAQLGVLNNLTAQAIQGSLALQVHAADSDPEPYEMVVQVGTSCLERAHCPSNTSRCIRPVALSTGQADLGGVCVFDAELPVASACDGLSDRSGNNPEGARHLGDLRNLRVIDVPLCGDDEDWYAFDLAQAGPFPLTLTLRSVDSEGDELAQTFVHLALHRSIDLAPVFVENLALDAGAVSVELTFPRLSPGAYHLRIVQLNRRALVSTYSLEAGSF